MQVGPTSGKDVNEYTELLKLTILFCMALILPEWRGGSTTVLALMPRGSPVGSARSFDLNRRWSDACRRHSAVAKAIR